MDSKETGSGTVRLRRPRPDDAAARQALGHDPEIVRMFGGSTVRPLPPLTAEEAASWLASLQAHPHAWIVEHEGCFLGEARLDGLDGRDKRARLAIGLYDPAKLGGGLGREAVRLVLGQAFGPLGLHRVDLRVLAYNTRAIRCYLACGFVVEGREREAALVDGVRHDDLIMGTLSREFHATARTMDRVRERASRIDSDEAWTVLKRAGTDAPPREGDELEVPRPRP